MITLQNWHTRSGIMDQRKSLNRERRIACQIKIKKLARLCVPTVCNSQVALETVIATHQLTNAMETLSFCTRALLLAGLASASPKTDSQIPEDSQRVCFSISEFSDIIS